MRLHGGPAKEEKLNIWISISVKCFPDRFIFLISYSLLSGCSKWLNLPVGWSIEAGEPRSWFPALLGLAALLCLAGTTCTLILAAALGDLGVAVSINLSPLLEIGDIQIIHAFLQLNLMYVEGSTPRKPPPPTFFFHSRGRPSWTA